MPKKFKSWADNFIKEDNTPPEPQKRPGTCFNCGEGSFSLRTRKKGLKKAFDKRMQKMSFNFRFGVTM
jgi:hypothetical protein